MARRAGDLRRADLRSSCTLICSGPKMKGSSFRVNFMRGREVFNEDPDNSNHIKKCTDFREGLTWSPLPNGRNPRLVG
jgi:hypothetical protein